MLQITGFSELLLRKNHLFVFKDVLLSPVMFHTVHGWLHFTCTIVSLYVDEIHGSSAVLVTLCLAVGFLLQSDFSLAQPIHYHKLFLIQQFPLFTVNKAARVWRMTVGHSQWSAICCACREDPKSWPRTEHVTGHRV